MENLVLGIVGWSGSGKTTLLEALLPRLSAMGLKVNVIKHSHHDVILEPAHKDSARLRTAGAAEILLASPHRYALIHELRDEPEPSLAQLISRLGPADLTLVEGFKWETIPKMEIYRPALGKTALYPQDANIVAVASDAPAPDGQLPVCHWLNLNQPDDILTWLSDYLACQKAIPR